MRTTLITLIALLAFAFQGVAQDAREITDQSTKAIEFEAMEMATNLYIHDNRGNTRERQVAVATRKFGDVTKTMMRFLSPADVQGTSILIHDYENKGDDMWVYLPSMRRTRRIVTTEKGKSFMGSEFSNADMSRPNIDDFTYSLLGEETVNGKDCWKVESLAKSREVESEYGFKRRVSYIEKSTYLIQKSELYDRMDKLNKIMTLGDYRKQSNGRYFSYQMEMKNVQNNRRSEMKVNNFQLGSKLSEDKFSVSSLEN
ncbi:MAG: outer membrane lipoprotein-sorting protein [Bacteroidales bacterium]|nr:outer membrane lipoprotein-sorting protein [Bacteroidales bacterium]MDD3892380.1 outer membrane lipoprotein-sorting protein [Bacteroidales bacterium]